MARDDGEQRAMTSERLAEIRQLVAEARRNDEAGGADMSHEYWRDVSALLAEVERLRAFIERLNAHRVAVIRDHEAYEAELLADNERLREIVREVAGPDHEYPDLTPGETRYLCPFCAGNDAPRRMLFVHADSCIVTQARALLASTAAEAGEQAAQGEE